MPVIATPLPPPTNGVDSCVAQSTLGPRITTLYDIPVFTKLRCAVGRQGQLAQLEVIARTANGDPIDLTSCGVTSSSTPNPLIRLRFCEAVGRCGCKGVIGDVAGAPVDARNGKIRYDLTGLADTLLAAPGVYDAETGFLPDADTGPGGTNEHANVRWTDQFR